MNLTRRSAFSFLELCAVLVIVVLVATLLIWRVSRSRQSSRRIECENQFRNLFVALESYHLRHGSYPIGTQNPTSPIRSEPKGYHHNWIEGLLPQLELQSLYDQIDFQFGVYAQENRRVAEISLEGWICPAAGVPSDSRITSYVGICSSHESPISPQSDGTFIQNRPIAQRDLADGLAYVVVVGEKVGHQNAAPSLTKALGWNSGTRASLRTLGHGINGDVPFVIPNTAAESNRPKEDNLDDLTYFVGGVSSNHAGGAYLLTAAGEIRFYSEQMDQILLRQLGGRADSREGGLANGDSALEISDEKPQQD